TPGARLAPVLHPDHPLSDPGARAKIPAALGPLCGEGPNSSGAFGGIVKSKQSFSYRPGLDGLRALAVAAVFAYHLDAGWARGGGPGVGTLSRPIGGPDHHRR